MKRHDEDSGSRGVSNYKKKFHSKAQHNFLTSVLREKGSFKKIELKKKKVIVSKDHFNQI